MVTGTEVAYSITFESIPKTNKYKAVGLNFLVQTLRLIASLTLLHNYWAK